MDSINRREELKKNEVGVFVSLISSCLYHHGPTVYLSTATPTATATQPKATELVSYSYSYSYSPWAGVSVLPLSLSLAHTVVK